MGKRSHIVGIVAIAAVPAMLLAGCGTNNASGASATLARIQPTSFVTLVPATTTTTTTTLPSEAGDEDGTRVEEGEQTYTVQSGDSVYRIATIHGIEAEVLATYNEWPEGINHTIVPGDIIRIPPGSLVPASGTTLPAGVDPPPDDSGDSATEGCTYVIQAGDNPSKVADKFGITVQDLVASNPESVMNSFLIGATLIIPAGADCDQ